MSYTELYMQTTGNNANAGSTTADSASVTQTNGSWDVTGDTFIATALTPFSGVSVGEWASIYNDGATSAVYVAQVVSINSGGLSITLSTTAKYGTKPAAGATGKSCKIGGAWADAGVVTSLFGSVAVPAATRVNIKAGTYANTTTSRTFGSAGLTTAPLWWRGYNTAIGDLDNDFATAKPAITFTTGVATISGVHQQFSNLSFSGSRTAGNQVTVSVGAVHFDRCRFEATGANAASSALTVSTAAGGLYTNCWFKATSTATRTVQCNGVSATFKGCDFEGGGNGSEVSAQTFVFRNCVFRDNGTHGILATSIGLLEVDNCTFYSPGTDGIRFATAVPTTPSSVTDSIFSECGGYGINNATGTNTAFVRRHSNLHHSNTSGNENGFGDMPSFMEQSDSPTPFTNAAGGDFSLVSGSNARAKAMPGVFENLGTTTNASIGTWQAAAGGGGQVFIRRGGTIMKM